MRKIIIILFILKCLTSCAPKYSWYHPHLTEHDLYIHSAECDMYAQSEKMAAYDRLRNNPMAGIVMIAAYDRAFESCMASKGWRKIIQK